MLVAVPAGQADHDKKHAYAGNWTIDPTGVPGKLKLAAVPKSAGLAAIRAISPSRADDCEFRYPKAQYYSGSFTTPTDNGPIAGCDTSGKFDGIYISRTFAPSGPYGHFDMIVSGSPNAFITAPGEPEPLFGGKQVALRFDGHFDGDGADADFIEETDEYRIFLGLDDPTRAGWPSWIVSRAELLARRVNAFRGVNDSAEIPGERSFGKHSTNLLLPGNDLYLLLAHSAPPADLYTEGNVYARVTPRFEAALRRKIHASSGNLEPDDVAVMALQVTDGSWPLAALTAHNLLKNVTVIGRETIKEGSAPATWRRKRNTLLERLRTQNRVVSKLRSLRKDPDAASARDKMGPWYHAFAVLSAGALINPFYAPGIVVAEHGSKLGKLFSGEGGYNREKASIDAYFARVAVSDLKRVSRWSVG